MKLTIEEIETFLDMFECSSVIIETGRTLTVTRQAYNIRATV